MGAKLSRRFGGVSYAPVILALPLSEQVELDRLTVRPGVEFEDLPERYQRLILEAEAFYTQRRRASAGEPEPAGAAAPRTPAPALSGR
jgi:hypothetical protein